MTSLSSPFYQFFVYVEPFLSLCGGLYAWFIPSMYHRELLPTGMLASLKAPLSTHQADIMAIRQLGNCYFLLAIISFNVLPAIVKANIPLRLEIAVLRTFFGVLAVADLTHIGWTMYDLQAYSLKFKDWNTLVHGNTTLVVGLFVWRCAWFLHSGRLLSKAKSA